MLEWIVLNTPDEFKPFLWCLLVVGLAFFIKYRKFIIPFMIAVFLFVKKTKADD